VSVTEQEQSQLERIEAKMDIILAKLAQFEQAAAGFMSGPAIGKMFAAMRGNGSKD
jgi:hypothetical protein